MTQTPHIQHNLLHLFRLVVGLRLILVLTMLVRWLPANQNTIPPMAVVSVGISLGLILYLTSSRMQHLFGRAYLPLALCVSTLAVVAEQRIFQARLGVLEIVMPVGILGNQVTITPPMLLVATTAFLFVPLVLVSWQYPFRVVVGYTFGMSLIDLVLTLIAAQYTPITPIEEIMAIGFRGMSFLIVGYIVTQLVAVQQNQTLVLETTNQQLAHHTATLEQLTISRERNRLARELHDTLAHTLSAVTVKLNAADLIWDNDPSRSRQMMQEVIAAMDTGLNDTRRALRDLRASPLEDMGLLLALEQSAQTAAERTGSHLDLHLPSSLPQMSFATEQGIYRIAQEGLENIVKHANARCIEVRLTVEKTRIQLTIRDDGHGFDPDHSRDGHFGLHGMAERADMMGGTLTIHSQPGRGVVIQLALSLSSDSKTEHIS